MHVLIFNIYFHPEPTGTGLVVGQLATDLAAMGHEVTVVTTRPHYGVDADGAKYAGRLIAEEQWEGVRVLRTGVPSWPRRGVLARAGKYLSYTLLAVPAGLRARKPDVVLCLLPPATTGIAAWLVKWWRGVPLVVNVQDVYPDSIFRSRLSARLIGTLERVVLRSAARVTALSEGLGHEVLERGAVGERLDIVPMWTDTEHVRPGEKHNAFRARHSLTEKFVVLYSGNIGTFGGVGVVIQAAALLADDARVQFLVVGRGYSKRYLMDQADALGLKNVMFLDTQPREVLPEMLAAADVSLVTLDPRLARTSVPSKAFAIMASARPVLAAMSQDNEVARIVRDADCGWCVPADRPDEVARVIRNAMTSVDLEEMGLRGRRYVEQHHARGPLTGKHAEVLEAAIADRKSAKIDPQQPGR
ncbi:MAG: glycosyltransferase [Tepidisphaera sp.]|nr:glycosyltransferase [Tepidisphaera sp.]